MRQEVLDHRKVFEADTAGGEDHMMTQINITIDSMKELEKISEIFQNMAPKVPDREDQEEDKTEKKIKLTRFAEPKTKAKEIDDGKLMALYKAGRTKEWIADDMGISIATVYNHLKKLREEGKI